MDEIIKKLLIGAIISIIVVVIVYPLIGIFVITSNTVIYDRFPEKFTFNPNGYMETLEFSIRNNAPVTLAPINPIYNLRCNVESETDAYVYFLGSGNKKCNFTDYYLDIGLINAGEYDVNTIYLVPGEGNLTLSVNVYLRFFAQVLASSNTYSIDYLGDYTYEITKLN